MRQIEDDKSKNQTTEYEYGDVGGVVDENYELPSWVKSKIPRHIYAAIAVELYKIFVPSDVCSLVSVREAIKRASVRFNFPWILSYYDGMAYKDPIIRAVFTWELMQEIQNELEWFTQTRTTAADTVEDSSSSPALTMDDLHEGEIILYQNGDHFELGKIKRLTPAGAFVWYSSGDTAAKTPYECIHKIVNGYVIQDTALGGRDANPSLTK